MRTQKNLSLDLKKSSSTARKKQKQKDVINSVKLFKLILSNCTNGYIFITFIEKIFGVCNYTVTQKLRHYGKNALFNTFTCFIF